MREPGGSEAPDAREDEAGIFAGDRRLARPDASVPDWEVPDTAYRPVPIVWFTAALLTQNVAQSVLLGVLGGQHPVVNLAASVLASAGIGWWTWDRGMAQASGAWKVATVVMLALFFALFALAHLPRL
ncbi:hypothetical protein ACLBKU_09125 [Erythrobacter sp. NE805]|uniref:hypothetical protein n=1 Tax=Erythrobacter sp. NE805 TaxID=3389875 RepID=UPI00396AF7CF